MGNSFLILPELEEMLDKAKLFSKRNGLTRWHQDLYTDLKATLKTLIALESE